jgi:hypothetical protein
VAVAHERIRVLAALVLVVKVLTAATPLRETRVTGRAAVVAEPHNKGKTVFQTREAETAETVSLRQLLGQALSTVEAAAAAHAITPQDLAVLVAAVTVESAETTEATETRILAAAVEELGGPLLPMIRQAVTAVPAS